MSSPSLPHLTPHVMIQHVSCFARHSCVIKSQPLCCFSNSPSDVVQHNVPGYICWYRYEKEVMVTFKCSCSNEACPKLLFCIVLIQSAHVIYELGNNVYCNAVVVVIRSYDNKGNKKRLQKTESMSFYINEYKHYPMYPRHDHHTS